MEFQSLIQYADFLWIPVILLVLERRAWLVTCGFVLACALLLRLQVQLLAEIGFPRGITGMIDMPVFQRGLITYSVFILVYLLLAYFSKGTSRTIHLAASIATMVTALCVSSVIMVL